MQVQYYLFLILSVLNLGPLIRFRETRYFNFFFLICLIDPVFLIIYALFNIPIQGRYYHLSASLVYLIVFPLFDKKIKLIFISLILFSLLIAQKYSVVTMLTSVTVYLWMIIYIITDVLKQYSNNGRIEVFKWCLTISLLLNIIRDLLHHEYKTYYYEIYNTLILIDLMLTILIIIFGPNKSFSLKKKNITIKEKNQTYDLTNRELQIINLISKGLTSKEIADKLYLSKKTVDYYRCNIRSKLNITKKSDLITFYNTKLEHTNTNSEY